MKVGFAGLGRMGWPMALNLLRAGHDVTVWNRSRERAQAFAAQTGARMAATPRELAENAEIVVTMLSDDKASETVHRGDAGLFAASRGAGMLVEMGTMSPGHIAALAAAAPEGVTVIDAPVSGATHAAADAALMIMVGASEETAAPAMPLFEAMGKETIVLGKTGAGAIMKLAVNMIIHGLNQTVSEALCLAEASGIAAQTAFDVIEASAAGAPMLKYRRPLYLDEAAHDVTFTVDLARKDLEVTAALAEASGAAIPQARLNLKKLRAAVSKGYGERDMASIFDYMRKEGR
jgi:3-hydroxyisobutyrate dehydrogenase